MNEEYRRLREEVNGTDKAFIDAIKEAKKKFSESEQDAGDMAIMLLDGGDVASVFGAVADALAEHGYKMSVNIDPDTDTPSLYGWITD